MDRLFTMLGIIALVVVAALAFIGVCHFIHTPSGHVMFHPYWLLSAVLAAVGVISLIYAFALSLSLGD